MKDKSTAIYHSVPQKGIMLSGEEKGQIILVGRVKPIWSSIFLSSGQNKDCYSWLVAHQWLIMWEVLLWMCGCGLSELKHLKQLENRKSFAWWIIICAALNVVQWLILCPHSKKVNGFEPSGGIGIFGGVCMFPPYHGHSLCIRQTKDVDEWLREWLHSFSWEVPLLEWHYWCLVNKDGSHWTQ